jgi:DNA ligase D-like protein (predicted 3'-phosphoesterase)
MDSAPVSGKKLSLIRTQHRSYPWPANGLLGSVVIMARRESPQLAAYRRKRDFKYTPEPAGRKRRQSRTVLPGFVIQKHQARSLHYDFRLEVNGVLKSWAVPKGPSLNPADRRLAVEVEDHPLEYGKFEGVIPPGQYGAGTVIVWDRGKYQNHQADKRGRPISMNESIRQGNVEIWLEGEKIRGGYALVRTRMSGRQQQWLLIKKKDEAAESRRNPIATEPQSVLTGRTLEQVAAGKDIGSHATRRTGQSSRKRSRRSAA